MKRQQCGSISLWIWLPAAFLFLLSAIGGAASFPNACRNSLTPAWDQSSVSIDASAAPSPADPGKMVTLTGIRQTMTLSPEILLFWYNLELFNPGPVLIPVTVHLIVDATGTVPAQQSTNFVDSVISTTVTDPDGSPYSGDESATSGSLSVAYADESWTATASVAAFQEHPDAALTGTSGGGIIAVAHLADGHANVQIHCTAGTVTGNTPTFLDPTPTFATTDRIFGDDLGG